MQSKPLQSDAASRISGEGTLPKGKLGLKQRLFDCPRQKLTHAR